jgi:hypothetical protein
MRFTNLYSAVPGSRMGCSVTGWFRFGLTDELCLVSDNGAIVFSAFLRFLVTHFYTLLEIAQIPE